MTDSEDELIPSNVHSYRNEGPTIHAKGPNFTNVSSFSCRNNFSISTMHILPRNFERRDMNYDQRSLYYKRDTSPMSVRSVQSLRPRNFPHPYNRGGFGYQRSVFNGRSSPTSMRSIDTTTSISAKDIALAFKNENFNKRDLMLIKEAYNNCIKSRLRRRVEKRRNRRLFSKKSTHISGGDSGEQGSNSSISSDDCQSTRTVPCVMSNSSYKTTKLNEGNMYNDITYNLRKNSMTNKYGLDAPSTKNPSLDTAPKAVLPNIDKGFVMKDRFKKGFLLPSQRFNKSLTGSLRNGTKARDINWPTGQIVSKNARQQIGDTDVLDNYSSEDIERSEQDEIFSEITTVERNTRAVYGSQKRYIDSDELTHNPHKKSKMIRTEVIKQSDEINVLQNDTDTDFIFVKPQMPATKSVNAKKKQCSPEKLISKSMQPFSEAAETTYQQQPLPLNTAENEESCEKEIADIECHKASHISNDISMRPSFIKRKLFTQKLDVTERKNINDTSQLNSPQIKNVISNKTKTRKLASTQSCLTHDVVEDGNNFLDLIHRIVPAEQMNLTNATNKTACNRNSQADSHDKWDVTSVISTCNDNNVSDTYTDEEIFKIGINCCDEFKGDEKRKIQSKVTSSCRIVLQKLPSVQETKTISPNIASKKIVVNGAKGQEFNKKNSKITLKSFWDTDLESDQDYCEKLPCNSNNSMVYNKENTSIDNNMNSKKFQRHKPDHMPIVANVTRIRKKSQKGNDIKSTSVPERPKKTDKSNKRNTSPVSKENNFNGNFLNRSLLSHESEQNIKEKQKPTEISKAVKLISHRMGRPKRQGKSKIVNSTESPLPKDNISSSEFNISSKSLRSYQKNNKTNEKLLTKNLRTRSRSHVKGV